MSQPTKVTQVQEGFIMINASLEQLEKDVAVLEDKLTSVLSPSKPVDKGVIGEDREAEYVVPVASSLRGINQAIYNINRKIQDYNSRIEL